MTREEFAAQCERGAVQTAALPATSAILRWTAEQLKRGEPAWWKPVAKAIEKRPFRGPTDAAALFVAALHFEALNDAECPLVPYFPSCGGSAEVDPTSALAKTLAAPPGGFLDKLKTGDLRAYSPARAFAWLDAARLFFHSRSRFYYLVEVGAGAGLDLIGDALLQPKGFDSGFIEARVGLDRAPVQVEDMLQRRWLTAGCFPDDGPTIARLDEAIELLGQRCREDATFVQLAPCPDDKAPAFVAKNVPAEDDTGLLLYNSGVTAAMTDAQYAAYAEGVAKALRAWGDRGLWVEFEPLRGQTVPTTYQTRVARLEGGVLRSAVLATYHLGGQPEPGPEGEKLLLAKP